MNKLLYILLSFALLVGCTKDENAGLPDLDTGAVANIAKDAATQGSLPPGELSSMNAKFDIDIIADDAVKRAQISVVLNAGADEAVYGEMTGKQAKIEVTLNKLLASFPDLIEADFVEGTQVSFYVSEIEMVDGRVFNNDRIQTNQVDAKGDPIYIKPSNLTGDFSSANMVFNVRINYFIACPSDIVGTYTMSLVGFGGGGLSGAAPYESTIKGVTIERLTDIEYKVSHCFGGIMNNFYSAYGGGFVGGNFYEICGTFKPSGTISDGWSSLTFSDGEVKSDGSITVKASNPWGDGGTLVYTPE